jgi:hypothetical protein
MHVPKHEYLDAQQKQEYLDARAETRVLTFENF